MAENQTEKTLTPKQRKAIESLLTKSDVSSAAAEAGVGRDTIYRWLKDSLFVAELRAAEAIAVDSLSRALTGLGDLATVALRDALDESQKITVRLRASEVVIGNLLRVRELVNLEERLAALEKSYDKVNQE